MTINRYLTFHVYDVDDIRRRSNSEEMDAIFGKNESAIQDQHNHTSSGPRLKCSNLPQEDIEQVRTTMSRPVLYHFGQCDG